MRCTFAAAASPNCAGPGEDPDSRAAVALVTITVDLEEDSTSRISARATVDVALSAAPRSDDLDHCASATAGLMSRRTSERGPRRDGVSLETPSLRAGPAEIGGHRERPSFSRERSPARQVA